MTLRDEQETWLEARHSKMALVKLKAVPPELLPQLIRTVLDINCLLRAHEQPCQTHVALHVRHLIRWAL